MAEPGRIWQNIAGTPCTCPPSQPPLYSTCHVGRIWQNLAEYNRAGRIWQKTRPATPCTLPPVFTILTSTIFHLPVGRTWQNIVELAEYGRRRALARYLSCA